MGPTRTRIIGVPMRTLTAGFLVSMIALTPFAFAQDDDAKDDAKEDAPKWNIDDARGDTFEQRIQTDEGTWVSLDVSPDGSTIAFDILGDLYTMPITGGVPTRITSGPAWDMQPRFSPDGSRIAFTSDRTGKGDKSGDNIWVIDADGQNPVQITAEDYRLLNNPNWHPSGEYIVARKHFTSRRSLGSGEMWLYHVSGVHGGHTGGLQLTEKPTAQKDVNEPVYSPDGRYLYFSEDASPGGTFQYNKDSNKQIYIVNRLDTETGESERYITGPGGAVRPQPSPDGKLIAFVRRHNGKSALHLYDTTSGAVQRVYDVLERDHQEAWAIHGVYPGFAWEPDGKAIVFYAKGKIRRLNLETGSAETIPFSINDTRTVTRAVRFAQDVAPENFDVKMLRWTTASPDGSRTVFQALGKLYITDSGGTPARLTDQNEYSELYPAFSRDGRELVYTTWDDQDLGSIRVRDLRSGKERTITTMPGHFIAPSFSPDGAYIVAQKVSGGWLRTSLYSNETGIYLFPSEGGETGEEGVRGVEGVGGERLVRTGSMPHFGASGDRVYFTRTKSEPIADNRMLLSVDLSGNEEREHFKSTWATEFRVSPDGAHIAFIERFNVYIAPFLKTGKAISVGPKTKSLPLTKVSSEAGGWVHFSNDGSTLNWSLGPKLYSIDLETAFASFSGTGQAADDDETEDIEPVVTDLGFTHPYDNHGSVIAITNARIVTMNGEEIIEPGTVVITGNRITAVGLSADIAVPSNAEVIDATGQTVLPGFIDAHAHGAQGTSGIIPQQNWVDHARLGFGVTTIHDPSNHTTTIFAASELAKAGLVTSPRTFSTGTILYGATGSFKAEIASLEDARFHLNRMKEVGAFTVKSYNQPRREQRQMVLQAARELGMMVVPEGGSTHMHNLNMIVDGHTGIEHTLPVETIYKDVVDLWRDTGVGYTPTLSVAYGGLSGEFYWYSIDEVWKNKRVNSFIPPHVVHPRSRRRETAPKEDYNHIRVAAITKQIIDIGGIVQAGGHGQLNGLCTHWEMWSFVQGGMSPFEALRSGTLHGAQYLGLDGDLGTIEKGKLADLIIFEKGADPLANIRDSQHIRYTVANGRVYDAMNMDQIAPVQRHAEPFFWESDDFSMSIMPFTIQGCAGCGYPTAMGWASP